MEHSIPQMREQQRELVVFYGELIKQRLEPQPELQQRQCEREQQQ